MKKRQRWDTHEYEDMEQVWRDGDRLNVRFRDGTDVQVAIDRLLPSWVRGADWDAMTFTPYHIVLPTAEEDFGIPWDVIRVLTDPEFAAYLTEAGKKHRRETGLRLQELRASRNLSREQLAERTGLTPEVIERVERGDPEQDAHLSRILTALGYTYDALSARPRRPRKQKPVA